MTNKSPCTRRQILQLTGGAAVVGLAGCTEALSGDGQSGADPTETPVDDEHDNDHNEEESSHEEEESSHDDGHEEEESSHDEEESSHDDGHEEEESSHDDDHNEEEGSHDEEESSHDDGHDDGNNEDGHGHNHDEGAPEEPSATAEVKLQTEGNQHHFAPHVVWVEPGGTVTWVSESGQHDAVAYHPDNGDKPLRMPEEAETWGSGLLTEKGETFSHTFETEGVYDYFCTPHEAVGMVGTVIVGDPDAHEQPALEEPQDSLPDGAKTELEDLGQRVDEVLGHTH